MITFFNNHVEILEVYTKSSEITGARIHFEVSGNVISKNLILGNILVNL